VIVWFGEVTVEIVPVFSGSGQGMVTKGEEWNIRASGDPFHHRDTKGTETL